MKKIINLCMLLSMSGLMLASDQSDMWSLTSVKFNPMNSGFSPIKSQRNPSKSSPSGVVPGKAFEEDFRFTPSPLNREERDFCYSISNPILDLDYEKIDRRLGRAFKSGQLDFIRDSNVENDSLLHLCSDYQGESKIEKREIIAMIWTLQKWGYRFENLQPRKMTVRVQDPETLRVTLSDFPDKAYKKLEAIKTELGF